MAVVQNPRVIPHQGVVDLDCAPGCGVGGHDETIGSAQASTKKVVVLEVLDDLRVALVVQLGCDEVVLVDEECEPDITGHGVGKGDVGVQVDLIGC